MTQLFDKGPPDPWGTHPCTPAKPGTGPEGETCGTCRHSHAPGGTAKRYYKCRLMEHERTSGAATDIKLKWPACSKWEAGVDNLLPRRAPHPHEYVPTPVAPYPWRYTTWCS